MSCEVGHAYMYDPSYPGAGVIELVEKLSLHIPLRPRSLSWRISSQKSVFIKNIQDNI